MRESMNENILCTQTHLLSLFRFTIKCNQCVYYVSLLFSINLNELNAIIKFQINSFLCCFGFFLLLLLLLLLRMDSLASKKREGIASFKQHFTVKWDIVDYMFRLIKSTNDDVSPVVGREIEFPKQSVSVKRV